MTPGREEAPPMGVSEATKRRNADEIGKAECSTAPADVPFDADQARRFLEALDPEARKFTFQTFDDGPGKRRALARTIHDSLDGVLPVLKALSSQGAGVFVTVNATDGRGRKAENVTRVRAVFSDFDGTEPPDPLPLEPSIQVQSKHGRHLYWLATNVPLERFSELQQRIAAALGSDPAVKDLPRVMRLPGTLHQKNPRAPSPVTLLEARPGHRHSLAEIEAAFPPLPEDNERPERVEAQSIQAGDRYAERALDSALAAVAMATEGARNDTLNRQAVRLLGMVKAGRLDEQVVRAVLSRAAQAAGLGQGEVKATLQSAWKAARPVLDGMPPAGGGESPPDSGSKAETAHPMEGGQAGEEIAGFDSGGNVVAVEIANAAELRPEPVS